MPSYAVVNAQVVTTIIPEDGARAINWSLWLREDHGTGSEESLLGQLEDRCQIVLHLLQTVQ